MIDVGLIGFGLAGRAFHAQVIRAVPGLRLVAILQRSGNEAAEKYPEVCVVRTLPELLAIPEIRRDCCGDAECNACAHCTGLPGGRPRRGGGQAIRNGAEGGRRPSGVGGKVRKTDYCLSKSPVRRRFSSGTPARDGGNAGRIVRFETNYDRFRPELKSGAWREREEPGAGILFDLAPHLIDHALVLFGVPEAVTADVRRERAAAVVDDAFDVMLHYPDGMRAVLRSTMLAAVQRPRFVLQGTQGAFFKQTFDPKEINLRNGIVPEKGSWGAEPPEDWGVLTTVDGSGVDHAAGRSVGCLRLPRLLRQCAGCDAWQSAAGSQA